MLAKMIKDRSLAVVDPNDHNIDDRDIEYIVDRADAYRKRTATLWLDFQFT